MKKFVLSLIVLLFFQCSSPNSKRNESNTLSSNKGLDSISINKNEIETRTTLFDYSNTVLESSTSDTVKHLFSSDSIEDYFILNVPEGNINSTKSSLSIIKKDGDVIYHHSFLTSDLINGYELPEIKTDEEMGSYLQKTIKSFFSNAFLNAGYLTDKSYLSQISDSEEEFSNYRVFIECKQKNLYIFQYGLQEENISFLGYSSSDKRALKIASCC